MGRHSRKGPVPQGARSTAAVAAGEPDPERAGSGKGRRRRAADGQDADPEQQHGGPAYATPAHGVPQVRGGHPEQREAGGGWGGEQRRGAPGDSAPHTAAPPKQPRTPGTSAPTAPAPAAPRIPGPRREFIEAFDDDAFDAFGAPASRTAVTEEGAPGPHPTGDRDGGADGPGDDDTEPVPAEPARGGKGRALTGIAAAAVTTVLAVVVAGQVTDGGTKPSGARAADGTDRASGSDDTSRSDGRPTPSRSAAAAPPPTYAQLMTRQFPLDPELTASGDFTAVPGLAKAPGKGQKFRYRVDIEKGLGLDGGLFAEAVQKTLNDDRSWAHNGAMTFERISSGEAEFVITLASPGTTGVWCAKSGLDTTIDNVSCDSASTDRVMINAFRWARGAETFGDKAMLSYRQMLINHEVGHRLGHNHVSCRTPGALAPVMQQQTKSLDIEGIKCRPNPWVFPDS
ncbi:DUF3152 domain-containing protein [Streptomyces scopuliridis]|uniref:DUF3152 domain-containing protein n=1 Tax=Streptomyces scopuliridis TaxID=452529 RepID=UPI002DD99956|nr:DUF3152 domain-containing protein [Streptomyces scopuliridis]WSB33570.1 DUF3152 domain-containing protein [Streptomyces scopuliridis]